MSIKFFHIFFIAVCVVFSLAVGVFCMVDGKADPTSALFLVGAVFVALGLGLIVYLIYFLKKIKTMKKGVYL